LAATAAKSIGSPNVMALAIRVAGYRLSRLEAVSPTGPAIRVFGGGLLVG
jgi:hypothetical protein